MWFITKLGLQIVNEHRVDLDRDHARRPAEKMRSQRTASWPDFDDRVSLLRARNFGDTFQNRLAREKMLPKAATQATILTLKATWYSSRQTDCLEVLDCDGDSVGRQHPPGIDL